MRLKVELHTHTVDDPIDWIPHTAYQLIDRAAELSYDAVAVTLHDRTFDIAPFSEYASARGIVLIPGVERTIDSRHILLINFSARAAAVAGYDDIARLKHDEPQGIVVAPHPFYPTSSCLRGAMAVCALLVDAVELNAMYTRGLNPFNAKALAWARAHGKPLVGNCDVHRLSQLGTTYSLVDAESRNADAICAAIRAGRVTVHSEPLGWWTALTSFADIVTANGRHRRSPAPVPSDVVLR
jgi:predicted metal-dependent phosphoesterase TrpH